MVLIILLTILIFTFYYVGCMEFVKMPYRLIFVGLFVISSFILRYLIDPVLNKDYHLYFDFKIFHKPEDVFSIFIGEPYLYLLYSFFGFFLKEKVIVFVGIYWFNFLINTVFFVWLMSRKDVLVWKKVVLFSLYYFLFGFVLLRNSPAYMLFAYFFYHAFRRQKFNLVLLAPFMHLSSLPIMITFFHKSKYYYTLLAIIFAVSPATYFVLKYFLHGFASFQNIISKVNSYSMGMEAIGILHKLFLVFISILLILGAFLYKKKMFNPIIITVVLFYYVFFFINPIAGYRFSPYLLFALFLFDFEDTVNEKVMIFLNYASILLFPCFLYTLFDTHLL